MAASILSLSEQKKAFSGKNKKKKIKNVLGLPTNVKVECFVIGNEETKELGAILCRLLPLAKIPLVENKFKQNEENTNTIDTENMVQQAKEKRKELSLGVNDLNRSIKKDLISAAIFASDISPKFLIHHLNLLCIHNKVPFLHMAGLRKITQNSLGFPCIALGFKKNFNFFKEAVKKISEIAKTNKNEVVSTKTTDNEKNQSDEEEVIENPNKELTTTESNIPFKFLYRNSTKERVFSPENQNNFSQSQKKEMDFIAINADTEESEEKTDLTLQGISDNVCRKHKNKIFQLEIKEQTSSSEEEYYSPWKRAKKSWIIDKTSLKQNFEYSPANVIKVHSNPNRKKNKNKKK